MLNEEFFNEFVEYYQQRCYRNVYYSDKEEEAFYSLILTGKKSTSLKKFFKGSKENLKAIISPEFKRLMSPLVGTSRISLGQYLNLFPSYDKANLLSLTEIGYNRFYSYYSPDNMISARLIHEFLYNELYGEDVAIVPVTKSEREVISFSNETEDAIKITLAIDSVKNIKGRTVQTHLLAEDYGFEKDKMYFYLVTKYAKSIYSEAERNPKMVLKKFIEADWPDEIPSLALKWMNPSSTYPMHIPYYYKASLYCLLRSLKSGAHYKADDLYEAFKKSSGIIKTSNNFADIYYREFSRFDYKFSDGEPPYEGEEAFYNRYEELISKPIFFALLYIFALLGAIDITEKEPELRIQRTKTKKIPYSPFYALDTVAISDYGKWVLSLSTEKPEKRQEYTLPVLDKDLLLITYKGSSVELKSFFSSFAEPLGQIRYKVTLQSFTKNIEDPGDLLETLKKFKAIFPLLPSVWADFFNKVKESFYMIEGLEAGMIYKIKDQKVLKEMMADNTIRKYFLLVEGGHIFIANENFKKLKNILDKRGYRDPFFQRS